MTENRNRCDYWIGKEKLEPLGRKPENIAVRILPDGREQLVITYPAGTFTGKGER
jgi:hypothetical protein